MAIFSAEMPAAGDGDLPVAWVMTPPLGGVTAWTEQWLAGGPTIAGGDGHVRYRCDGEVVLGCVALHEADHASPAGPAATLAFVVEKAYAELFRCMSTLGYPRLVRVWNYLPNINDTVDGVERYRKFNEARQRSFQIFQRSTRGNVPAACTLGSEAAGALVVYFIAGRAPVTAIDNPRQVPAYDYPSDYGACSPTFSRAALTTRDDEPTVVRIRHRKHPRAPQRARRQRGRADAGIVRNLEALIDHANRAVGERAFDCRDLQYKAYLRRPEDLAVVAHELEYALAPRRPVVWLRADICRAELLVEIEAFGVAGQAAKP